MKIATCTEPWGKIEIEKVIERAADIGYDGVEIAAFTLADSVEEISTDRRKQIARAAADAGIEIVGLHWLFASPTGLHLTAPDESVRRRSADYLKKLVDFCGDLGGKVMVHGSPKQRNIEPPTTYEEGWKRAKEVWASAGDTLAARGVTLCIEGLAPAETNFIQTAEEAAKMADEIGHPNIDIMLDIKAMSSMPDGVIGTIEKLGARAKHFHINQKGGEGAGVTPESGPTLDIKPILDKLKESGYQGWLSLEPFKYEPDADTVATIGLQTVRLALK